MLYERTEDERLVEATVHRALQDLAGSVGADRTAESAAHQVGERLVGLGLFHADDSEGLMRSMRVVQIVARESGRACLAFPILEGLAAETVMGRAPRLRPSLSDCGVGELTISTVMEGQAAPIYVAGRLQGIARVVPFADRARRLIVPVRQGDGRDSSSIAVIDMRAAGIHIHPRVSVESDYPVFDVALNDVRPLSSINTIEDGTPAAMLFRLTSSLLATAEIAGASATALEMTRQYMLTRTQFGRPLGANQALKHVLANNYVRLETMTAAAEYAAMFLEADPRGAPLAVLSAKHYASRVGKLLAEDMLQLHGAIGYTQEYALQRFMRRILRLCATHGTPSTLTDQLFGQLEAASELH